MASTTACNATRSAFVEGCHFCNCYLASGAYTIPHGFEYLGVGQCIGPRFRALSYESAGDVRQCERACLRNPDCTAYEVNPVDRSCHYFVVEIDDVPNRLMTHTFCVRRRSDYAHYPPSPPPVAASPPTPQLCTCADPHLALADGGAADFRGRDGALYAFVSSPRSAVNVRTRDAVFLLDDLRVDGSFLTEVHVVGVTARGRRYIASFSADGLDEHQSSARMVEGACGDAEFALGAHAKYACDGETIVRTAYASATFELPEWTVVVTGLPVYRRFAGPHHRLDVTYTARVGAGGHHGVIGQSYDGKGARYGAVDHYPRGAGAFRTSAMAEGAIDGVAVDYEVDAPHETAFRYSAFGAPPHGDAPRWRALSWAERPTLASRHDPLVQAPASALAPRTSAPVREWSPAPPSRVQITERKTTFGDALAECRQRSGNLAVLLSVSDVTDVNTTLPADSEAWVGLMRALDDPSGGFVQLLPDNRLVDASDEATLPEWDADEPSADVCVSLARNSSGLLVRKTRDCRTTTLPGLCTMHDEHMPPAAPPAPMAPTDARANPYGMGGACADGSDDVVFGAGVVGCDGTWPGLGLEGAAALCAPGWHLCQHEHEVVQRGLDSCGPSDEYFYVTNATCAAEWHLAGCGGPDVGCGTHQLGGGLGRPWKTWLGAQHASRAVDAVYKTASAYGGTLCCAQDGSSGTILRPYIALHSTDLIEGSGGRAHNISITSNNVVVMGSGMMLYATTDEVSATTTFTDGFHNLRFPLGLSVRMQVKPSTLGITDVEARLFRKVDAGATTLLGAYMRYDATGQRVVLRLNTSSAQCEYGPFVVGRTYDVVVVFAPDHMAAFVDGVAARRNTDGSGGLRQCPYADADGDAAQLGQANGSGVIGGDNTARFYTGRVELYDRPLTGTEVRRVHDETVAPGALYYPQMPPLSPPPLPPTPPSPAFPIVPPCLVQSLDQIYTVDVAYAHLIGECAPEAPPGRVFTLHANHGEVDAASGGVDDFEISFYVAEAADEQCEVTVSKGRRRLQSASMPPASPLPLDCSVWNVQMPADTSANVILYGSGTGTARVQLFMLSHRYPWNGGPYLTVSQYDGTDRAPETRANVVGGQAYNYNIFVDPITGYTLVDQSAPTKVLASFPHLSWNPYDTLTSVHIDNGATIACASSPPPSLPPPPPAACAINERFRPMCGCSNIHEGDYRLFILCQGVVVSELINESCLGTKLQCELNLEAHFQTTDNATYSGFCCPDRNRYTSGWAAFPLPPPPAPPTLPMSPLSSPPPSIPTASIVESCIFQVPPWTQAYAFWWAGDRNVLRVGIMPYRHANLGYYGVQSNSPWPDDYYEYGEYDPNQPVDWYLNMDDTYLYILDRRNDDALIERVLKRENYPLNEITARTVSNENATFYCLLPPSAPPPLPSSPPPPSAPHDGWRAFETRSSSAAAPSAAERIEDLAHTYEDVQRRGRVCVYASALSTAGSSQGTARLVNATVLVEYAPTPPSSPPPSAPPPQPPTDEAAIEYDACCRRCNSRSCVNRVPPVPPPPPPPSCAALLSVGECAEEHVYDELGDVLPPRPALFISNDTLGETSACEAACSADASCTLYVHHPVAQWCALYACTTHEACTSSFHLVRADSIRSSGVRTRRKRRCAQECVPFRPREQALYTQHNDPHSPRPLHVRVQPDDDPISTIEAVARPVVSDHVSGVWEHGLVRFGVPSYRACDSAWQTTYAAMPPPARAMLDASPVLNTHTEFVRDNRSQTMRLLFTSPRGSSSCLFRALVLHGRCNALDEAADGVTPFVDRPDLAHQDAALLSVMHGARTTSHVLRRPVMHVNCTIASTDARATVFYVSRACYARLRALPSDASHGDDARPIFLRQVRDGHVEHSGRAYVDARPPTPTALPRVDASSGAGSQVRSEYSSTHHVLNIINGVLEPDYGAAAMDTSVPEQWFMVDLGAPYQVTSVRTYNRLDSQSRFAKHSIRIGNVSNAPFDPSNVVCGDFYAIAGPSDDECHAVGRYAYVVRNESHGVFTVREIEVYGHAYEREWLVRGGKAGLTDADYVRNGTCSRDDSVERSYASRDVMPDECRRLCDVNDLAPSYDCGGYGTRYDRVSRQWKCTLWTAAAPTEVYVSVDGACYHKKPARAHFNVGDVLQLSSEPVDDAARVGQTFAFVDLPDVRGEVELVLRYPNRSWSVEDRTVAVAGAGFMCDNIHLTTPQPRCSNSSASNYGDPPPPPPLPSPASPPPRAPDHHRYFTLPRGQACSGAAQLVDERDCADAFALADVKILLENDVVVGYYGLHEHASWHSQNPEGCVYDHRDRKIHFFPPLLSTQRSEYSAQDFTHVCKGSFKYRFPSPPPS